MQGLSYLADYAIKLCSEPRAGAGVGAAGGGAGADGKGMLVAAELLKSLDHLLAVSDGTARPLQPAAAVFQVSARQRGGGK